MKYNKVVKGRFHSRPNRFIAKVYINQNGEEILETVHVKNTGRCKELLIPGADVILEESDNKSRKTKYDLICVYKEGLGLVNMDSQAPNKVVKEWLEKQKEGISKLKFFENISYIKPEYKYGKSRIDFYIEDGKRKILLEVKGVTLEIDGVAYFPDAPTERGVKHIEELAGAIDEGYETYLAYVIQMKGIDRVLPNGVTHPEYKEALEKAVEKGVKILYLGCKMEEDSMVIDRVSC